MGRWLVPQTSLSRGPWAGGGALARSRPSQWKALQAFEYGHQHTIHIVVHFLVREANSRKTVPCEKSVATGVANRLVSLTINLDDQALRRTEEVGDVMSTA